MTVAPHRVLTRSSGARLVVADATPRTRRGQRDVKRNLFRYAAYGPIATREVANVKIVWQLMSAAAKLAAQQQAVLRLIAKSTGHFARSWL